VSPVLFVIYLSGLFGKVEKKEEDCGSEGISFVDDVAWVVEGKDVGECTQRLERCAAETTVWAKKNACRFDIEKTEAMLFTRRRKNKEPKMNAQVRVGDHEVPYNKEATRWLGVWLDDMLTPSAKNNSVRAEWLRLSRQRHPGGGLLRPRRQYHTSRCISPSHRSFTVSSTSVGLLFLTNTLALKAICDHM